MSSVLASEETVVAPGTARVLDVHGLAPGRLLFSEGPLIVEAVVRSGIVVMVGDFSRPLAGVVQFVLPDAPPNDGDLRCGGIAIPALVEGLRRRGGEGLELEAKLFGGALSRARQTNEVGAANAVLAVRLLAALGVPVVASDMGGVDARRLVLDLGNGHVSVDPS